MLAIPSPTTRLVCHWVVLVIDLSADKVNFDTFEFGNVVSFSARVQKILETSHRTLQTLKLFSYESSRAVPEQYLRPLATRRRDSGA